MPRMRNLSFDLCVGRAIKEQRKKTGMSQEKLGEIVGVSYQQIQKYENGVSAISILMFIRIARVLKIHPVELFKKIISRFNQEFNQE